jgi:hypothetical protein
MDLSTEQATLYQYNYKEILKYLEKNSRQKKFSPAASSGPGWQNTGPGH